MNWKIVLTALVLAFGLGFAQVTGKVIVAYEDTMIVRELDIDTEEFDEEIEIAVEMALDEIDLDDEDIASKDEIRKLVRKRVGRALSGTGYPGHISGPFEKGFAPFTFGKSPGAILLAMIWFTWMLVFLIMWIVSLIVIGRGFGKIARSIREKEEN